MARTPTIAHPVKLTLYVAKAARDAGKAISQATGQSVSSIISNGLIDKAKTLLGKSTARRQLAEQFAKEAGYKDFRDLVNKADCHVQA
jgi:predicted NodU family carbamoyl transferase